MAVVTDDQKRLVIWGYKSSPTHVKAPLLYIAPYLMRNDVELNNGVTIEVPNKYLGSTYPIAAANEILPIINPSD
jgi:hypothetical protein